MKFQIISVCLITILLTCSVVSARGWDMERSNISTEETCAILGELLRIGYPSVSSQIDYMDIHADDHQIDKEKTYQRVVTITITIVEPEKEYIGSLKPI